MPLYGSMPSLQTNFKVNLLKGGQPRKFAPIVEEQKQKWVLPIYCLELCNCIQNIAIFINHGYIATSNHNLAEKQMTDEKHVKIAFLVCLWWFYKMKQWFFTMKSQTIVKLLLPRVTASNKEEEKIRKILYNYSLQISSFPCWWRNIQLNILNLGYRESRWLGDQETHSDLQDFPVDQEMMEIMYEHAVRSCCSKHVILFSPDLSTRRVSLRRFPFLW